MKYIIAIFFSVTILFCNAQAPQAYKAFDATDYNLFKWEGNKIVLLTQTNTLDYNAMSRWVEKLDAAYNYYQMATGAEPYQWHLTYLNGRSTIAFVDSTCGAGCGYLGSTGIEMMQKYFNELYGYTVNNQYSHIPFYEFGRNFWFYDKKLNYKEIPNVYDPVATGYAVVMRFMSMEYINAPGSPFGEMPFEDYKASIRNILNTYLSDPSLTWYNTLAENKGIPSYRGAPDLFASFCLYMVDHYGGDNWIQNVWKYAGLRPDAVTTQDAVDNFIIASSRAANQNLASLFQSWRWPISAAAIQELNNISYVLPVKFSSFSVEKDCDNLKFIWTTAMESSNKGFELQKSNDGVHFDAVGFVAGTNSSTTHKYVYEYSGAMDSSVYCRIKQIDNDGKFVYSNIVYTKTTCKNAVVLYPNPVSKILNIKYIGRNSVLKLVNTNGVVLQQWNAKSTLDLSGYPSGIYFLIIDGQVHKIFKR